MSQRIPFSRKSLAVAALGVACSLGAMAQSMDRGDKKFVEEAAMGGMAEVALGNLAQQQAASADVKQFGAHMAQDHGKANDELKQIATAKGMEVPAAPSKQQQKEKDKLAKMSGTDFDQHYVDGMVKDHKTDIALFQKEARSGKDADLKAFAGKTLPTLQQHLQMIQSISASMKSGASGKSNGAAAH